MTYSIIPHDEAMALAHTEWANQVADRCDIPLDDPQRETIGIIPYKHAFYAGMGYIASILLPVLHGLHSDVVAVVEALEESDLPRNTFPTSETRGWLAAAHEAMRYAQSIEVPLELIHPEKDSP